jgi:hypothetical protein
MIQILVIFTIDLVKVDICWLLQVRDEHLFWDGGSMTWDKTRVNYNLE